MRANVTTNVIAPSRGRRGRHALAGCAARFTRRTPCAWATALAAVLVLAGCAAAPVPPTVWLRLPALPADDAGRPAPPAATATPAVAATREAWQLALPLPMPAHLDRDAVFVPVGGAGAAAAPAGAVLQPLAGAVVQPLAGARWVEPLRDALPRLLREDLARHLAGQPLWTAPLPPGLAPTRLLRVEITAFEVGAEGQALLAAARWWLADTRGTRAPVAHEARFTVPVAAGSGGGGTAASTLAAGEAWALAHRKAVAELAARIAGTMSAW